MINGLEGIPGSGKSYEAVVYHVFEALKKGRKVITNLPLAVDRWAALDPRYLDLLEIRTRCKPVRGTWDANRIDEHGNGNAFLLFDDGHSEPARDDIPLFGHVWDFYCDWKHAETGQGPLYVIDECHVAFPRMGTPKQVVEWFKLHRHFNADVLLMTQSFRDICQEIARLLAMLIRCRKADILGRKDAYIRKVHGGYRGAEISTEERKYLPQYFQLYRSHTQGNSVGESSASDVKPFIVKWRRMTYAMWAVGIIGCIWAWWPKAKPVHGVTPSTRAESGQRVLPPGSVLPPGAKGWSVAASPAASGAAAAASSPAAAASSALAAASEPMKDPEPYAGKGLHITGHMVFAGQDVYVLTVSDGGRRLFDLTSKDLKAAGFVFEPLNDCAGIVRRNGKARSVTCDAPVMSAGSSERPIVFGQPVAVSDRRGVGGGAGGPSQMYVVPNSSGGTVQGYDPDRVSSPVHSVFESGVGAPASSNGPAKR